MINDQDPKEIVPSNTHDIIYFKDPSSHNYIVPITQDLSLIQNQDNSKISKYQGFSEFSILELNRRYDHRPRLGPSRLVKKVMFDEPQVKSTETQTPLIQPQNHLKE